MPRRVAVLSVHTSPLAQPGTGDAGGMNVYVLQSALHMARRGVEVEHVFLEQFIERFGPHAVVAFQGLGNVHRRAERQLDPAFCDQPHGLDHCEVEWIIGGDHQRAVVGAHRHDVVLKDDFGGHLGARGRVNFLVGNPRVGQLEGPGQFLEEFFFGHRSGFNECRDQGLARAARGCEQGVDL